MVPLESRNCRSVFGYQAPADRPCDERWGIAQWQLIRPLRPTSSAICCAMHIRSKDGCGVGDKRSYRLMIADAFGAADLVDLEVYGGTGTWTYMICQLNTGAE